MTNVPDRDAQDYESASVKFRLPRYEGGRMSVPLDRDWPGRPTRRAFLAPRGLRERLALLVGPSLVERYDFELAAETSRSDAGWQQYVIRTNQLAAHGPVPTIDLREVQNTQGKLP